MPRFRTTDEALERTAEALAIAERKGGERWYAAELHRLRGELSLRAALAASDCEQHFRRAIEVARGQAAKSFELRATISLAHMLCDTGRREDARAMLAEIYGWFTEGFDTADLVSAKVLLDELGP